MISLSISWFPFSAFSASLSFFLFFFSSRRRHTRCLSDWSSDVCSSDLIGEDIGQFRPVDYAEGEINVRPPVFASSRRGAGDCRGTNALVSGGVFEKMRTDRKSVV